MRKIIFAVVICLLASLTSTAQIGGLFKKKKDKEPKTEVVKTDTIPQTEDDKPEKKKKGGGLLNKVIGKVAKGAGGLVGGAAGMINTVDNLDNSDVIVSVGTNIYSKDLGLAFNDFLGKEWVNNGDFTMLQIAGKSDFTFSKYSGVIKVNGKELKHASMGIHTVTEAPQGKGNKIITFEKDGVVEGSFEVPLPEKNIKLVSINGQTKNVKVDFTKDVILEFDNFSKNSDALIRVDVIVTQIGFRSLTLVAYVKPAAKVTIPATVFKHLETESNVYKFKDSYLSISEQFRTKAINAKGVFKPNQLVTTGSNDGMWVDVTNSPTNSKGITDLSGVVKRNAAFAMPLSFAKKIAVGSFYTNGTTYAYSEKSKIEEKSTMEVKDHTLIKETTKTKVTERKEIQLPQIPDDYLQATLAELYNKITKVFVDINGSTILPVNTIPNTPSYENSMKFMPNDLNTKSEFFRTYENLKPIGKLTSVNNLYYGVEALIADSKADAMLKVSLSTYLDDKNKAAMIPYLRVELVGPANGSFRSFMGNTNYFTMEFTGSPYELKKKQKVDFTQVFQVESFVNQFKEKFIQLKAKEDALKEYEMYWNLQK